MTYRPFFARAKKSHARPFKGRDIHGNLLPRTRKSGKNVNDQIDNIRNPVDVNPKVSNDKEMPSWSLRKTKTELLKIANDLGVMANDSMTKAKIIDALDASVSN